MCYKLPKNGIKVLFGIFFTRDGPSALLEIASCTESFAIRCSPLAG